MAGSALGSATNVSITAYGYLQGKGEGLTKVREGLSVFLFEEGFAISQTLPPLQKGKYLKICVWNLEEFAENSIQEIGYLIKDIFLVLT